MSFFIGGKDKLLVAGTEIFTPKFFFRNFVEYLLQADLHCHNWNSDLHK